MQRYNERKSIASHRQRSVAESKITKKAGSRSCGSLPQLAWQRWRRQSAA
jgi:hypothetical protein